MLFRSSVVNTSVATLTVNSGPVFSSVTSSGLSSLTGTNTSQLTANKTANPGAIQIDFTAPISTLAVARGSMGFWPILSATFAFSGATLQKNGRYERTLAFTGDFSCNLNVAGAYRLYSANNTATGTFTLTLS